ncbi:hypothetical protein EAI_04140, partial [Harpegnathos saltator]
YTNEEYRDIVLIYGERQQNAREAARIYRQRYSNRPH